MNILGPLRNEIDTFIYFISLLCEAISQLLKYMKNYQNGIMLELLNVYHMILLPLKKWNIINGENL